jgi:hypothetical protein
MKVTYEGCAKLKKYQFRQLQNRDPQKFRPLGHKKTPGQGFFEVQVGKRDSIPEHFLLQLSTLLRLE